MKSISYDRFLKAANKAKNIHEAVTGDTQYGNEFFVKINNELVKINLNDVQFIEAYGDYVKVNTLNDKYVFLSTMKSLATKLPETDFMRIHKSYLIRLDRITRLDSHSAFIGDTEIPVSRTYREQLKSSLTTLKR